MTTELEDINFEQLIGDRDIDVCKLIEEINEWGITRALYFCAYYVIKGRWSEAEPHIMKDSWSAYYYARYIIRDRWPEAEPCIKKNPHSAYCYAFGVIKGRWPEAEPYVKKDPKWASRYSNQLQVEL